MSAVLPEPLLGPVSCLCEEHCPPLHPQFLLWAPQSPSTQPADKPSTMLSQLPGPGLLAPAGLGMDWV